MSYRTYHTVSVVAAANMHSTREIVHTAALSLRRLSHGSIHQGYCQCCQYLASAASTRPVPVRQSALQYSHWMYTIILVFNTYLVVVSAKSLHEKTPQHLTVAVRHAQSIAMLVLALPLTALITLVFLRTTV